MHYVKEIETKNREYRVRTVEELKSHHLWKDMEDTYCISGEHWGRSGEVTIGLLFVGDCYEVDPLFVKDVHNYQLIPVESIEVRCDLGE